MQKKPILLVDDDEAITATISSFLRAKGYAVTAVNDGAEALEEVRRGLYPVIVTDIYIDQVSGLQVLEKAKASNPGAAVIMMTARGSLHSTVAAEEGGAFEYLAKPFGMPDLLAVIQRALEAARSPQSEDQEELPEEFSQFGNILGFAPPMIEVYKRIARFARSEDTVLIIGETGAGKELVARAIHDHSARAQKPFLAVDSGAVPGTLWESELFGSLRGAFTGADRDRPGVVDSARGGTVFLDEIGEIPLEFQGKLLRFLEQREYRPLGAPVPRKADVRVIAATNRNLENMVREGKFREDLMFRLNVLRIDVPPLRERRGDIPLLARKFLHDAVSAAGKRLWLAPDAAAALQRNRWPGNVRELKNAMHRLAALTPAGGVNAGQLEAALASSSTGTSTEEEQPPARDLADVEKRQILKVLEEAGGNKTRAAQILGIQRRTLYKKLERFTKGEPFGHGGVPETLD